MGLIQDDSDSTFTGAVDNDGFPIGRVPEEKKKIEALVPIDHSTIEVGLRVPADRYGAGGVDSGSGAEWEQFIRLTTCDPTCLVLRTFCAFCRLSRW